MTIDDITILNESQHGWVSVILYRRWTGTYAVARFDARKGFIGTVYACTGGIRHAHRYFERMGKGEL
jgi:hypothetical protein